MSTPEPAPIVYKSCRFSSLQGRGSGHGAHDIRARVEGAGKKAQDGLYVRTAFTNSEGQHKWVRRGSVGGPESGEYLARRTRPGSRRCHKRLPRP